MPRVPIKRLAVEHVKIGYYEKTDYLQYLWQLIKTKQFIKLQVKPYHYHIFVQEIKETLTRFRFSNYSLREVHLWPL